MSGSRPEGLFDIFAHKSLESRLIFHVSTFTSFSWKSNLLFKTSPKLCLGRNGMEWHILRTENLRTRARYRSAQRQWYFGKLTSNDVFNCVTCLPQRARTKGAPIINFYFKKIIINNCIAAYFFSIVRNMFCLELLKYYTRVSPKSVLGILNYYIGMKSTIIVILKMPHLCIKVTLMR